MSSYGTTADGSSATDKHSLLLPSDSAAPVGGDGHRPGGLPLDYAGSSATPIGEEGVSGIERLVFVAALKKNRDRIRHCRTVPFSVLTYALFITALLLHVTIGFGYDFETMLIQAVPLPDTPKDFLGFLQSTLLPKILPNGNPEDTSGWRRINGNVMVVGGVRILTQRRANVTCSLPTGPILDLYGHYCGSATYMSLVPFGNATAAGANASEAFVPSTVVNDPSGARFQLVLDPTDSTLEQQAAVQGLIDGGWVDNLTASVDVQFAALNGEAGLFGRASVHVSYSLGSLDAASVSSTSVPVDPYQDQMSLIILDVLILLYWCYLVAGTVRRVKESLFPRNRAMPWKTRFYRLSTSYWRLLDIATTVSMLITFIMWIVLVKQLIYVRENFNTEDYSKTHSVEQDISNAATVFGNFKVAAVITLATLTLRLFKYFAYQPRLAVISESISRGCGDALHFILLLSVLVVFFCIWGYFMFGTQVRFLLCIV